MLKIALAATVFATFAAPVWAGEMIKCDDSSIMKMDKDVEKMTDKSMKKMAMQELTMAKDSMKMNKMDDCMMHMENAHKNMM